MFLLYPL